MYYTNVREGPETGKSGKEKERDFKLVLPT